MENANTLRGYLSFKAAGKFCLLYFIFLLILTLIFSAFNCEPMTDQQKGWWWGFIVSLVFTISVFAVALSILIYTDHYAPPLKPGQPEPKLVDLYESSSHPTAVSDQSRTQSYKTILTINSAPVLDQTVPEKSNKIVADSFMNLTPSPSSGVTVVDMPAINAKRKENMNMIQSPTGVTDAAPIGSGEKKKKRHTDKARRK